MKLNQKLKTYLVILSTLALVMSIPTSSSIQWGEDTRLTTDTHQDFSPAMTQTSDGRLWVVWHSPRIGYTNNELYYKTYKGITWSPDTRLTFTSDYIHDVNPAIITTKQGKMWLVWSSNRTGSYNLWHKTSTNNGEFWSPETQLTNPPIGEDKRPAIMEAADNRIWIVWQSGRTGNDNLFYKTYDGISWSSETQLTFDAYPNPNRGPAIMQSRDGKIWVFWGAVRATHPANFEIYYKTSIDNGASWSAETRLTVNNAWDLLPTAMQTRDGKIWVIWEADRSGQDDDLFYMTYDGTTWSNDAKLTGDPTFDDILPNIFQAENKTIWVTFSSSRMDDMDIWYKTAKSLVDAAVVGVTTSSAYAYRGYGTRVYVTLRNFGTSTLTFPVNAYYNGNVIGTQTVTNLGPDQVTTLTFTWSATSVPLSNCTISAATGSISGEEDPNDNSLTNGIVEVRIPGDVTGDKAVNVFDAILISTYFGKPIEFPEGDINDDGKIDIYDTIILSTHYGQTG